jgi:hypothetical protein
MLRVRFLVRVPWAAALVLFALDGAGCNRSSSGSSSSVVLNEVMSRNAAVPVPDAIGRPIFQDWVELYNGGTHTVSLNGYTLTDNPDRPDKFVFPPGITLEPRGFVVVYLVNRETCVAECADPAIPVGEREACEANCLPSGLVADFGLSATSPEGEAVYLYAENGATFVSRIGIRLPEADTATGRFPDAEGPIGLIYEPRPGGPNVPPSLKRPRLGALSVTIPDETEPARFVFTVDQDLPEGREATAVQGELLALVEYLVIPSGSAASCPPSPADLDGAFFTQAPAVLDEDFVEIFDDTTRQDADGRPVTVQVLRFRYRAELPQAPCDTRYFYRVIAEDGFGESTRSGCLKSCENPADITVLVNEYQPRNQEFIFDSVDAEGNPREPSAPDWLEIINFGGEPIEDIGKFFLVGRGICTSGALVPDLHTIEAQRGFKDGSGNTVPLPPLAPGEFLWILADDDGGPPDQPRRVYTLQGDTQDREFFSTRFGLEARRQPGDADEFCLLSPSGFLLDRVVLDFDAGVDIGPGQSAARFPETEGFAPHALQPGTVTDCPTPGAPNLRFCDVPPSFEAEVSSAPRCPAASEEVVVRGRVNFDQETDALDLELFLVVEVDGVEAARVVPEITLAEDQSAADPSRLLYDYRATIPGQPAGALIVFRLEARDLRLVRKVETEGANEILARVVVHDEAARGAEEVSFRYLSGYVPPADAPRINEVLPLPPPDPEGGGAPPPFPEFAEILNPASTPLDLHGYYLTDGLEGEPLERAKKWMFPEGTTVPAGGYLVLFFDDPPAPMDMEPPPLVVDRFGFSCRFPEALFLVAPDDRERGANCVVDSMSWDITIVPGVVCERDQAVGIPCEGVETVARLSLPTPGAPNSQPTLVHDAFHTPTIGAAGDCVSESDPFVVLSTVVFVDSGLIDALGTQGVLPEIRYLVDRGQGEEEFLPGPGGFDVQVSTLGPCEPGFEGACASPPPGYGNVVLNLSLLQPFGPPESRVSVVSYRVLFTDACGASFEAGPYSYASDAAPHPDVALNELNRAAPAPGADGPRPWVELVNRSSEEAAVGGMFLSDSRSHPREGQLAEGLAIPAGGFLVVFLEEIIPDFGPLSERGTIFLTDTEERGSCIIDSFAFDFSGLSAGASVGRDPDGGDTIRSFEAPSPGASNTGATFVRGDTNLDERVNVTDMIASLGFLFSQGGAGPPCADALDANDDGVLNLVDVTYTGNAIFLAGEPIPPPFPARGADPTPDALGCDAP